MNEYEKHACDFKNESECEDELEEMLNAPLEQWRIFLRYSSSSFSVGSSERGLNLALSARSPAEKAPQDPVVDRIPPPASAIPACTMSSLMNSKYFCNPCSKLRLQLE